MAVRQAVRPISKLLCQRQSCNFSTASTRVPTSNRASNPYLQLSRAPIRASTLLSTSSHTSLGTSPQQTFRRSYADVLAPKPRRRIRTTLRWLWRLTYLGAIGGIGYMGYTIYLSRTPPEQLEADPKKKTLVILGTYPPIQTLSSA